MFETIREYFSSLGFADGNIMTYIVLIIALVLAGGFVFLMIRLLGGSNGKLLSTVSIVIVIAVSVIYIIDNTQIQTATTQYIIQDNEETTKEINETYNLHIILQLPDTTSDMIIVFKTYENQTEYLLDLSLYEIGNHEINIIMDSDKYSIDVTNGGDYFAFYNNNTLGTVFYENTDEESSYVKTDDITIFISV